MARSGRQEARGLFLDAQHQLRQPLNALSLLIGELREARSADDRDAILEDMRYALQLSNAWLDSLADLERAQRGLLQLQCRDVPLQLVFARLHGDFAGHFAELGLDFRIVATQAVVRADPTSLHNILTLLLENAGKFTRRGKVVLGCRRAGHRLRIEVWDSGVGVASGEEERLFEAFFRLENEVRPRDRGLGVGLTYARQLARLAGDALSVRSKPGKWSCFVLSVPLSAQPGKAKGGKPKAAAGTSSGYGLGNFMPGNPLDGAGVILLEGAESDSLKASLKAWGAGVRTIASKDLARALEERSDLVLADQADFDASGAGPLIAALENRPAVVLIADPTAGTPRQAQAGGKHILQRPVRAARLRSLCHFALTHR